jgi:hypothetical protein
MDVVSSGSVRANVEDLGKSELLRSIQTEIPTHKHDNATLNRTILNIWAQIGVFYVLEAKGLDLFWDIFETNVGWACVGHLTGILIEIDEPLSLLAGELHDFEVLFEEKVSDMFWIHSGMYYL